MGTVNKSWPLPDWLLLLVTLLCSTLSQEPTSSSCFQKQTPLINFEDSLLGLHPPFHPTSQNPVVRTGCSPLSSQTFVSFLVSYVFPSTSSPLIQTLFICCKAFLILLGPQIWIPQVHLELAFIPGAFGVPIVKYITAVLNPVWNTF